MYLLGRERGEVGGEGEGSKYWKTKKEGEEQKGSPWAQKEKFLL